MRLLREILPRTVIVATIGGGMLWGSYGLAFLLFVHTTDSSDPLFRQMVGGVVLVGAVIGGLVKRRGTPQWGRLRNAALGGCLVVLVLSLCSIAPFWFAPLVTAQLGAVAGALIGSALGFVNGLVLAVLTRLYHYPLTHAGIYRRQVRIVSTTIAFAGSALGIVLLYRTGLISERGIPTQTFRLLLIPPPLVGGLFAWYVSPWLAAWYERRSSQVGNVQ